tara:strand:+ start:144 stop:755 length:612 start_codon:yes stop_codon:yes gene_type:complete
MANLKAFYNSDLIEVGCDEAGRGCLSGPVVAASVVLPKDFKHPMIDDSKKLTEKKRGILEPYIRENAISCQVGIVFESEIDEINILNASFLAMHRSLSKHQVAIQHILVDGNRFHPYNDIPHKCIVGGDAKMMSIAAASILAKNYRDRWMRKLHEKYDFYGWDRNKGYPTKEHRAAILKYGASPYHRMTFSLLPNNAEVRMFS